MSQRDSQKANPWHFVGSVMEINCCSVLRTFLYHSVNYFQLLVLSCSAMRALYNQDCAGQLRQSSKAHAAHGRSALRAAFHCGQSWLQPLRVSCSGLGFCYDTAQAIITNNMTLYPSLKTTRFCHKGEHVTVLRTIFLKRVKVYLFTQCTVSQSKGKHTLQTTLQRQKFIIGPQNTHVHIIQRCFLKGFQDAKK